MGFISNLAKGKDLLLPRSPTDRGMSRTIWRQTFGDVSRIKEEAYKAPQVRGGGSYGRSITGTDTAQMRLLQALRSMAPGGWSDDRFEQTARHFVGISYLAIHRICTQWQRAEFEIFKKDTQHPDGKRPITEYDPPEGDRAVKPHHLTKLLERPNNQDSFGKYLYRLGQQKYLTGTSLTWMVPGKLKAPAELYCIPTALAIPQPAVNPDYPDGYYRVQPIYPYGPFSSYPTPASAVGAAISAEWVMRFQFPHPLLRYDGYSPLTGMKYHIDEVEMIDKSRHYKMRRSFNPNAVLSSDPNEGAQPLPESEIDRLRTEFENAHQGPENHGNLFYLYPGFELNEFGTTPKEMDYSSGWEQLVAFVLAGLGITKPAAGMTESTAYSQLYASLKQLYWLTLEPDMEDLGAELTHHLAPFFGDDLIVEVRCRPIDDQEQKMGKLTFLMNARALTKNEARKEMEFPVTKEDWGKEMAGMESQPQGGMPPGMEGLMGGGAPPGQPEEEPQQQEQPQETLGSLLQNSQRGLAEKLGEDSEQDEDMERARPIPGKLSRGSLGPRMKSLSSSIYDRMLAQVSTNGSSNGHA